MQTIGSLVRNAIVCPCQFLLLLPPILAAFHFAGQSLGETLDMPQVTAVVFLVVKRLTVACGGQGLDAQIDPNGSSLMSRDNVRNVYANGNKPVASVLGNRGRKDLPREPERFRHVDLAQLWDGQPLPIHPEFIVVEVK